MAQSALQIAGGQRRTLRAMRKRLLVMAAAWEDEDQFLMNEVTSLADKVEELAVALTPDEDIEPR